MKIRLIRTLILITGVVIISSSVIGQNKQEVYNYEQQCKEIKQLNAKVDSLIKTTSKIAEERNYFSTALCSQTTIFSVIITIIISLLSLVSYLNIKGMMLKQKKEMLAEMNKHKFRIDDIEKDNNGNKKLVNKALGNLNVLISDFFKDKSSDARFYYLIQAAKYQFINDSGSPAYQNLTNAKKMLEEDGLTSKFQKYDIVIQDLQMMIKSKDNDLALVSSQMICKILEFRSKNSTKKSSK